jgi:hypothetical protein
MWIDEHAKAQLNNELAKTRRAVSREKKPHKPVVHE